MKYPISQLDTKAEREKDNISRIFNEMLGWTGLGHVDGFDVDVAGSQYTAQYITLFLQTVNIEKACLLAKQIMEQNNVFPYQIYLRQGDGSLEPVAEGTIGQ